MICALMIGRAGSTGFRGKNIYPILGRPLAAYPLMAAKHSRYVNRLYVSTDSPEIMEISRGFGAELINRPPELATKEALGED
ncbi:MAG: cytidylyltransferase domain-containing protein, partial [Methylococcales bacterium]